MDIELLRNLLESVRSGKTDVEEAIDDLRVLPYEDIGFAKLDNHRHLRTGFPEVVFCQGKTTSQVVEILRTLSARSKCVLATRAAADVFEAVRGALPDSVYSETARIITVGTPRRSEEQIRKDTKYIMVLCAGTADIPVAEEAAVTASVLGSRVERAYRCRGSGTAPASGPAADARGRECGGRGSRAWKAPWQAWSEA